MDDDQDVGKKRSSPELLEENNELSEIDNFKELKISVSNALNEEETLESCVVPNSDKASFKCKDKSRKKRVQLNFLSYVFFVQCSLCLSTTLTVSPPLCDETISLRLDLP